MANGADPIAKQYGRPVVIHLTATTHILIATEPCDFRKGIDGFVSICSAQLNQNPQCGTLFIFRNRAATMVRILVYEHNGYWLMTSASS